MTNIFLSYARGDDEPFVRRLCEDLVKARFTVWFDRESLLSRGLTFHQEIRDAIRSEVDRIVYVGGPRATVSAYVREEWKLGLEFDHVVVTPILRLGTYDDIPGELSLLHCEDFREGADYEKALAKLITSLQQPNPKLGELAGVPSLPAHFLARPELMRRVRDALLVDLQTPHVITSAETHVGMQGMGGIGKSVLAAALARNRQVRQAYPEGIVWISCGKKLTLDDILSRLRDLVAALGGDANFTSLLQGQGILRELLQAKAVLLILDDVWDAVVAKEFDFLGPRCRMLITTRDAGILHALHGERVPVSLFTEAEALQLLADAVGVESSALSPEARAVAEECGQLPLALALAGGMAKKRNGDFNPVLERFRRADLDKIADRASINPQHESLWRAMQASVETLSADEQRRFAELAVFPEDAFVPEPAVATFWSHTAQLVDLDTEDLLINLSERSLIQLDTRTGAEGTTHRRISLHDLLHDYAVRIAGDTKALNQSLLSAYRAKCSHGWPTGPNDGYFFEHLRHHLVTAGYSAEAFQLLQDLDWLGGKTRAGLVFDLVRDIQEAEQDLTETDRAAFLPWSHFLRGNASFLGEHPASFFQQAYNEPVDSPVSQSAQHLWSLVRGTGEQSASASPALVPSAFLERLDRPAEWRPPACLMTLHGHAYDIYSVALSGDGSTVVSGSADQTVKVWDARTGACRATLRGHTSKVCGVALSGDSSMIVSGAGDQTVKVWDARTGACCATLQGHTDSVMSVALSGDGFTVVSGSMDNTAKVWDARTGECRATLQGHTAGVRSVAISADGSMAVSGSEDKTVKVWDARTGACHATLHTNVVFSVALSRDGSTIASESWDQTVKVWDARTGACLMTLPAENVLSVAISGDGSTVVSGSSDSSMKVWDARTGECRATLQGHTNAVPSVALSGDGSMVVSGSADRTVKVWNTRIGACGATRQGHAYEVYSVAISEDGSTVISGSADLSMKVWNARTGNCRATLQGHQGAVLSVVLSRDGSMIVSGAEYRIKIWDARTGECRATLQGHKGLVRSVALSDDGSTIVSGAGDKTVKVWDVRTGECRVTLQGHTSSIASVAFSRDGSTVVSGSYDKTVKVWDARTGACHATLQGHTSSVHSVALSGDGSTIVSGSDDKTVTVWDARTGDCHGTYPRASREARAAWQSVGAQNDAARCDIVVGSLSIPDPDGATPLIAF